MRLQYHEDKLKVELQAAAKQSIATALNSYGQKSAEATRELYDAVFADPNHWSGLLTLVGYALEGGEDDDMILHAARAMELLRASTGLNGLAATTGRDQAYMTLANLETATKQDRLKVISICSRSDLLYAHGVMSDAQFTNAIQVGMVLAGADCSATDDITSFVKALAAKSGELLPITQELSKRWSGSSLLEEAATKRLQF